MSEDQSIWACRTCVRDKKCLKNLIGKTGWKRSLGMQSHYWPGEALRFPGGWEAQISRQSAHEGCKVVSFGHRPSLPPVNVPGTHFCKKVSRLQGHGAAGRIMSMKNSNYTVGNRTRDLPACGAVRQPTAPPRAPLLECIDVNRRSLLKSIWKSLFELAQDKIWRRALVKTVLSVLFL